jgi:hypothetical protein
MVVKKVEEHQVDFKKFLLKKIRKKREVYQIINIFINFSSIFLNQPFRQLKVGEPYFL